MTTTETTPACMGGWCPRRLSCARYHVGNPSSEPAERLCGRDGYDAFVRVASVASVPRDEQAGGEA